MWNLPETGGVWTVEPSSVTTEPTDPSDEISSHALAQVTWLRSPRSSADMRSRAASGGGDRRFGRRAADIAQEAFVKAHRSLPKLSDPTNVKSWMLRIVANEAKNHVRGGNRRRRRDERYGSWVVAAPA